MSVNCDDPRDAVDQLIDYLVPPYLAGDVDSYARAYHPDAVVVDGGGRMLRGHEEIKEHRRGLTYMPPGTTLDMRQLETFPLADDVALATLKSVVRPPSGPMAGAHTASQTLVIERNDGEWFIRSFHHTFVRKPDTV